MSQQINPQSDFPIVRQLEDPADAATYFVQAVVRNSLTGVILDTINLTDQGNQRHTGQWRSSADTSGEGLLVDIETTVYTDSGHTTKSNNYAIVSDEYVVQQRTNRGMFGGSTGRVFDFEKIRKVIREELNKAPKGQRIDLSGVQASLGDLNRAVKAIKVPEAKDLDLSGVTQALEQVKTVVREEVAKIDIPEQVDEDAIVKKIESVDESVEKFEKILEEKMGEIVEKNLSGIFSNVHSSIKEKADEHLKEIEGSLVAALKQVVSQILMNKMLIPETPKEPAKIKTKLGTRG